MPTVLGELETLVLLATLRLGEGAYGVLIRDEIRDRAGRALRRGAIYSTIKRLDWKGFLTSEMGEATPVRGGRAKRYFAVTRSGLLEEKGVVGQLILVFVFVMMLYVMLLSWGLATMKSIIAWLSRN